MHRRAGLRRLLPLGSAALMAASLGFGAPAIVSAQDEEPSDPPRIGYISGGDSDPFVLLVTEGIREAARRPASSCPSAIATSRPRRRSPARARSPSQQLQSMINWQFYPDSSAGDLRGLRQPADRRHRHARGTLPGDVRRCQQPRGRADRRQGSGRLRAGASSDAQYDAYISLDFPTIAEINAARAGGSKEGFENVCGADPGREVLLGRHVRRAARTRTRTRVAR